MSAAFEITAKITDKMEIVFDHNESLLKFQQKHVSDISELTQPISKSLGITHFSHVRVEHSGKFRSLMTDTRLADYYHQRRYPIAYCNSKGISLNNGFYVIATESNLSVIKDKNLLINDFNIRHMVFVVNKNPKFDDLFVFGSDDDNFINLFVNNMDIVKHFIHYFNYSSRKIINNCPKIIYPQELLQGDCFNRSIINSTEAYEQMPLKKIFLTVNERQITISAKEYACLKYLIGSLTLKEIARIMDISPRTVETYFNSIKKKLQCETRAQLYEFMKSIYLA